MRTKKSIYNFITNYIPYVILVILGFIKIRVFVNGLGDDLFALNQLFNQIFSYLALTEAGIGAALTYRLYKPLAENKIKEINQLFSGTKKIFKRVGMLTIGVSIIVSFFLPLIINNNIFDLWYLQLTFLIFVLKNVIDYFMAVPRYVIQADQNQYKINYAVSFYRILEVLVEIGLLMLGIDYLFILIPGIFVRIVQNIYVNNKIKRIYPWLKNTKEEDFSVKKDIKHLFVHRIVGLVLNNIDIIMLSAFTNSLIVSSYAAYNYLMKYAKDTIIQAIESMKDGVGNAINCETQEKIKSISNEFFGIFYFVATFTVIVFYFVVDDFIALWLDPKYNMPKLTLILFLTILYYTIIMRSVNTFRNAAGLYKETKVMAGIEALINLTLSIILVQIIGLNGVLIASITAFTVTNMWYGPYLINKKIIKGSFSAFILKNVLNVAILFIGIIILAPVYNLIASSILKDTILSWLGVATITSFLAILVLLPIYLVAFPEIKKLLKRVIKLNIKSRIKEILFKIFSILPIKNNLITFESFSGLKIDDNPKGIYNYIINNNKKVKCIWFVREPNECILPKHRNTKVVKIGTIRWLFYTARSRIWVKNTGVYGGLKKRKGQYYVQTWHGIPIKKMGKDVDPATNNNDTASAWDIVISPCEYYEKCIDSSFGMNLPYLRVGYPRNDLLINSTINIEGIKKQLNISLHKKVILFAPTWRDNKKNIMPPNLNDDFVILYRGHHLSEKPAMEGNIIDTTHYHSLNELMQISDALVTDYSSMIFDYVNLNKPVFLYAPDLDFYKNKERGFYLEYNENTLPSSIAHNEKELIKNITNYNFNSKLPKKYQSFKEKFCPLEDGHASQRVYEHIENILLKK